jgi:hypothetical protein
LDSQAVQFGDQVLTGDGSLDQPAEAFAGVLIDDGHELDGPAVGGGVELEVGRPYPVGRVGGRGVDRCGRTAAVTPAR